METPVYPVRDDRRSPASPGKEACCCHCERDSWWD
jgi:hypothetical protein